MPALVLRDPSFYQFPHKGSWQGLVRLKADGPLAGVVVFKLVLVSFNRSRTHEVEGAVVRGRAESDKHSVLTESGELVADTLFSLRRRSPDGLSKFLERGPIVIAQGCEVLINGFGFSCHGLRSPEDQQLVTRYPPIQKALQSLDFPILAQ